MVKQLETVQMTAANKLLGCSKYDEYYGIKSSGNVPI